MGWQANLTTTYRMAHRHSSEAQTSIVTPHHFFTVKGALFTKSHRRK
jgi:hypothetical protein